MSITARDVLRHVLLTVLAGLVIRAAMKAAPELRPLLTNPTVEP